MNENEKSQPTRVRKVLPKILPKPVKPLSGWAPPVPPVPKPARMPLDWPAYFPAALTPRTTLIIGNELKCFPKQSQLTELCKALVHDLAPHLCEEARRERRLYLALSWMGDLVSSIAAANYDSRAEREVLEEHVKRSDEWLNFAQELTKLAESNISNVPNSHALVDASTPELNMAPFKWEDIDHSLISLKHTELGEELYERMKKEEATIRFDNPKNLNGCTVPTLILEMQKKYTDEWARRVYEMYCDVWQIQGYEKSAAFIRAVCSQAVVPTIRARANAIAGEFAMFSQGTSFSPNIRDAMLRGLDLDMKRLQSRWERRLEAEAKECEHAEPRRVREALGASGTSLTRQNPGRKPRLSQEFVVCAGTLWQTAILESGSYVSVDRLRKIAAALDAATHLPPADYLEGKYAKEVKEFNSRHSNSKIGPLLTWSKLVSHGDKDHIQGMRRLLGRCAERLGRGHPPSGINSGQKISS